jgi:hypothetical protein
MGCSIGTESHYAAFPLVTSAEDAGFEPARVTQHAFQVCLDRSVNVQDTR